MADSPATKPHISITTRHDRIPDGVMAPSTASPDPPQQNSKPMLETQPHSLPLAARHPRPPPILLEPDQQPSSRNPDTGIDEEADSSTYPDQDDARPLIQPALNPLANNLADSNVLAAERAAAIDDRKEYFISPVILPDEPEWGPYEGREIAQMCLPIPRGSATPPRKLVKANSDITPQSPPPKRNSSTSSSWRSGLRQFSQEQRMSGVFSGTRPERSFAAGTDALKRIQKALPSLSMPAMPNFSAPSFLGPTSPVDRRDGKAVLEKRPLSHGPHPKTHPKRALVSGVIGGVGLQQDIIPEDAEVGELNTTRPSTNTRPRPHSIASGKRVVIRRSVSSDSLLFHSRSRTSSLGDDNKFAHVSEQVNARFKAIVDSLPERPSFKLPQMPNIVSSPLKCFQTSGTTIGPSPVGMSRSSSLSVSTATGNTLDRVLSTLEGDIVILGGYRGSVLRSARPPNRQLWAPVKVGLNIRQVDLFHPYGESADRSSEDTIIATGMLQNIGPIDISRRLFKKLRENENCKKGTLRVWDYGYDWRLSPHVLSEKLQTFLEGLPCNEPDGVVNSTKKRGAIVVAHSLGGMVTRHAVNARPELFSGVVYAGTPNRCINILGPIRNGDAVWLNENTLTAAVNFSLRTSFVFLPEDKKCFVDRETGEDLDIDFYDAQAWVDNKLSPVVGGAALPPRQKSDSTTPFGSFINLSGSFSSLPLRGRKDSDPAARRARKSRDAMAIALGGSTNISPVVMGKQAEAALVVAPLLNTPAGGGSGSAPTGSAALPPCRETLEIQDGEPGGDDKDAMAYLSRTLAYTKQFRQETQYQPSIGDANRYPPMSVLYGKGTPTVYRARVSGREAIATTEAYDDLSFREGDGVVLALEAMMPPGYIVARGGRVSSSKGHLGLLGDMEGVGKALEAVVRGRRRGVGLGSSGLDLARDSRLGSEVVPKLAVRAEDAV